MQNLRPSNVKVKVKQPSCDYYYTGPVASVLFASSAPVVEVMDDVQKCYESIID